MILCKNSFIGFKISFYKITVFLTVISFKIFNFYLNGEFIENLYKLYKFSMGEFYNVTKLHLNFHEIKVSNISKILTVFTQPLLKPFHEKKNVKV